MLNETGTFQLKNKLLFSCRGTKDEVWASLINSGLKTKNTNLNKQMENMEKLLQTVKMDLVTSMAEKNYANHYIVWNLMGSSENQETKDVIKPA